jgi:hypothetical protein
MVALASDEISGSRRRGAQKRRPKTTKDTNALSRIVISIFSRPFVPALLRRT